MGVQPPLCGLSGLLALSLGLGAGFSDQSLSLGLDLPFPLDLILFLLPPLALGRIQLARQVDDGPLDIQPLPLQLTRFSGKGLPLGGLGLVILPLAARLARAPLVTGGCWPKMPCRLPVDRLSLQATVIDRGAVTVAKQIEVLQVGELFTPPPDFPGFEVIQLAGFFGESRCGQPPGGQQNVSVVVAVVTLVAGGMDSDIHRATMALNDLAGESVGK